MAQPLGYNETVKTVWQAALPGIPVLSLIDRTNYRDFLESAARGLARLHQNDLGGPTRVTLQDRLTELREKVAYVARAFPRLWKPLRSLVRDLEKRAVRLTPSPEKLIHGDFHIKQL